MTAGLVVGLTGGIGAGKSTVAELMAIRGANVVDVDGLGRAVLEPGGGAYEQVVSTFGDAIREPGGRIDRAALAAAVFGGDNRLSELEAISHPAINTLLASMLAETCSSLVVLDMAVLVESRLGRTSAGPMYQRVIVVEAPDDVRIPRLVERGMTVADARARMASQATDAERRAVADLVITNGGSAAELADHVNLVWPTIQAWQSQTTH